MSGRDLSEDVVGEDLPLRSRKPDMRWKAHEALPKVSQSLGHQTRKRNELVKLSL